MHDLDDFSETPEFDSNIEKLRQDSKCTMMNMIYNAVVNGEDRAISSDAPAEEKLKALNNIIEYFVNTEEYEKCSNIKKIIDRIQC